MQHGALPARLPLSRIASPRSVKVALKRMVQRQAECRVHAHAMHRTSPTLCDRFEFKPGCTALLGFPGFTCCSACYGHLLKAWACVHEKCDRGVGPLPPLVLHAASRPKALKMAPPPARQQQQQQQRNNSRASVPLVALIDQLRLEELYTDATRQRIQRLLKQGHDINAADPATGRTALLAACAHLGPAANAFGSPAVHLVEYLLVSCGARADCVDRSTKPPSTPISLAVTAADLVVVRRLLRAGADPSVHGLQPLLSSLSASFTACVELADALEIDVNVERLSMVCRAQTQAIKHELVKWFVQHSTASSSSTQQVGAADACCGPAVARWFLHCSMCVATAADSPAQAGDLHVNAAMPIHFGSCSSHEKHLSHCHPNH